MKNKLINQKGITIIALVITIIVLLILAGISISMISSQDSILNKATTAKEKTESAVAEERRNLAQIEAEMNPWDGKTATEIKEGEGKEETPYLIRNAEELAFFRDKINSGDSNYNSGWYKLENTINLNNVEWEPIGIYSSKPFKGHFDGNGYGIMNLNIKEETKQTYTYRGFFEATQNATIENLEILSGNVNGSEYKHSTVQTGAIIGYAENTSIINCKNRATVKGNWIGGIVGRGKNATITNCKNYGEIIEINQKGGGIISFLTGGKVVNSINYGKITADSKASGICSTLDSAEVNNCTNNGEIITNADQAAGIVAYQISGTVKNCINNTKVEAGTMVAGGIVANFAKGTAENCINNGEIIVKQQQAGGIIGLVHDGIVQECINNGNIISESKTSRGISGGIVGVLQGGEAKKCYNRGSVKVDNYKTTEALDVAGGVIGLLSETGSVSYCYSNCEIQGEDLKGDVVAQWNSASTASVSNCYYTGSNNGVGSKGETNTTIEVFEDSDGIVKKIEKLGSYELFKEYIKSNFKDIEWNN